MKKHNICWLDFFMGVLTASVVWLLVYAIIVTPKINAGTTTASNTTTPSVSSSVKSNDSQDTVDETVVQYQTDIQSATFHLVDKDISFTTPDGYYSLTDQYLASLGEYYGIETDGVENVFVVGDATNSTSCSTMLNVTPFSDLDVLLQRVYGDEYVKEDMLYSDAYKYMTTGELAEDLPLDFTLIQYPTITGTSGVEYTVYSLSYTLTYTYYDENDVAQSTPLTGYIPNYELCAYSNTEDVCEVIVSMATFDADSAYTLLCEFVGGEVPENITTVELVNMTEEETTNESNE